MDNAEPLVRTAEIDTGRLEAFSDGVMAVIITIMAFELHAPLGGGASALRHELPTLFVYILSFTFIGIYWNNHHHLLRVTPRISSGIMWANLHLLFWLSLIPVATEWVGQQYHDHWPAATYGIIGTGAALAYSLLVRMIIHIDGRQGGVAAALGSDVKGYVSLFTYMAAVGLAFVNPWIAYVMYACVSMIWFIPDRRLVR